MRILFVTHYYWPELGAPQSRLRAAAQCLAEAGHEVGVLTGFPNYPSGVVREGYQSRVFMRERVDGIPVTRTWILPAANVGFVKRILNHTSFAASSIIGSPVVGPVDVVVAESPPLFVAAAGVIIARAKRAKLVLSIADLWPEMAVAVGALSNRKIIAAAEILESSVYVAADHIIAVTQGIKEYIQEKAGLPSSRTTYVPNGVDLNRFDVGAQSERASGVIPDGKFVVMYAGTLSPSHALETVVSAAALVRDQREILFAFVGDGTDRPKLEAQARELELENVLFTGSFPNEEMPGFLARADVCLNSCMAHEIFEDAVPRKTVEYLASGRPLLMAGESRQLVEEYDTGIWVPPEQPRDLAEAVLKLHGDPEARARNGANARRCAEERFARESVCSRYRSVIEGVGL